MGGGTNTSLLAVLGAGYVDLVDNLVRRLASGTEGIHLVDRGGIKQLLPGDRLGAQRCTEILGVPAMSILATTGSGWTLMVGQADGKLNRVVVPLNFSEIY